MFTTQPPQASVLAGEDFGGKDVFRQVGRPAMHGSLRAEKWFVS